MHRRKVVRGGKKKKGEEIWSIRELDKLDKIQWIRYFLHKNLLTRRIRKETVLR